MKPDYKINAKEEFLGTIKGYKVICAEISVGDDNYNLKKGHTEKDFNEFLNQINFEYDSGYGGQELYGTIWCEDGIWCAREEYDGSEWWTSHCYPEIPEELMEE